MDKVNATSTFHKFFRENQIIPLFYVASTSTDSSNKSVMKTSINAPMSTEQMDNYDDEDEWTYEGQWRSTRHLENPRDLLNSNDKVKILKIITTRYGYIMKAKNDYTLTFQTKFFTKNFGKAKFSDKDFEYIKYIYSNILQMAYKLWCFNVHSTRVKKKHSEGLKQAQFARMQKVCPSLIKAMDDYNNFKYSDVLKTLSKLDYSPAQTKEEFNILYLREMNLLSSNLQTPMWDPFSSVAYNKGRAILAFYRNKDKHPLFKKALACVLFPFLVPHELSVCFPTQMNVDFLVPNAVKRYEHAFDGYMRELDKSDYLSTLLSVFSPQSNLALNGYNTYVKYDEDRAEAGGIVQTEQDIIFDWSKIINKLDADTADENINNTMRGVLDFWKRFNASRHAALSEPIPVHERAAHYDNGNPPDILRGPWYENTPNY